ncbi:MAG TPA: class I SAM-dependent methyltransferase [Bryobacteraceae bacterium]|nr:class I SAM-dependent methyltransferase [Bryobacteraceae bacterium]
MAEAGPGPLYAMGSSDAEHERLIRQAARLAPYTERFLRQAGIGPGQRILDLGSGVGDVAMLAARLAGPSGQVVGVERDAGAIERARGRAQSAGLRNVRFLQSDVARFSCGERFDAAIGRFILMYLAEPGDTLRAIVECVRPGGIVAFQEPSYAPFVRLSRSVALWHDGVSLVEEALRRAGANTEMGPALYGLFQEAGLPAPFMSLELPLGADRDFIAWVGDTLLSLEPRIRELGLSLESLGELGTLTERLHAAISQANTVVTWQGIVSAWSRKR